MSSRRVSAPPCVVRLKPGGGTGIDFEWATAVSQAVSLEIPPPRSLLNSPRASLFWGLPPSGPPAWCDARRLSVG
eukprot:6651662-Pyramimonas_sp.AAC.2